MAAPAGWNLFTNALLKSSAQAVVLVVFIVLIQAIVGRRLTPRWRYLLWWVVIVRLLVPCFIPGPASVFNWLRLEGPATMAAATPSIPAQDPSEPPVVPAPIEPAPPPSPVSEALAAEATRPSPITERPASNVPLPPRARAGGERIRQAGAISPEREADDETAGAVATRAVPGFDLRCGVMLLWAMGAMLLGGRMLAGMIRLQRRLRTAVPVTDSGVRSLLRDCQARLGMGRTIEIWETRWVESPALCGVLRPRLLFPPGLMSAVSRQQLRFIVLHELAHVRQRDLLVNWVTAFLLVLHWFNPFVWLAFSRLRSDRELACDALALSAAEPGEHFAYGETILRLLEGVANRSPVPGLVGILEDGRQMKRRIRMIADYRPARRPAFGAMVIVAGLAVVGLTDAQAPKPTSSTVGVTPGARLETSSPTVPSREVRVGQDPVVSKNGAALEGEIRNLALTVLDPARQPVPGAEIELFFMGDERQQQPRRVTGADGKFTARYATWREGRRPQTMLSVVVDHTNFAPRVVRWTSSRDLATQLPAEAVIQLEPGVAVGGVVQDEHESPLPGVAVALSGTEIWGMNGSADKIQMQEAAALLGRIEAPMATTDTSGRWRFTRYPSGLSSVQVMLQRPGGVSEVFGTSGRPEQHRLISLEKLKSSEAVCRLPEGFTIRGMAVDDRGQPLSGVTIREGYGHFGFIPGTESVTGPDGRFERRLRPAREWIYTASRSDRATVSTVIQAERGMPEVRLVLPPARPWRGRVLGESGQPLVAAAMRLDPYHTEGHVLDWSGSTDADGWVTWTNAPDRSVGIVITPKELGGLARKIRVRAGQTNDAIVISRAAAERVRIRVKATEAESHEPVAVTMISARFNGTGSQFKKLTQPEASEFNLEIQRSEFAAGSDPSFELRLEAKGYETHTTESLHFNFGDQDLELALRRVTGARQVLVHQPNGDVAVGPRVWTQIAWQDDRLFIQGPNRFAPQLPKGEPRPDGWLDGRVELPDAPKDAFIVLMHPSGFLATTMGQVRLQTNVTLLPYGVVSGRIGGSDGRNRRGVTLGLTTLNWSPAGSYHVSLMASTDDQGRFQFNQVPPGEYKVFRGALPPGRRDTAGVSFTDTYQMAVTVRAGETTEVSPAELGRPVAGQAVGVPDVPIDWRNDVHTLMLKLPEDLDPDVRVGDFASYKGYWKAYTARTESVAHLEKLRRVRTYPLTFQPDGSFRIEDVPPGAYELRIRITPTPSDEGLPPALVSREIGALVREILVPAGNETFDLGTLLVPLKIPTATNGSARAASAPVERPPTAGVKGIRMDGQPLSLAQFHGTNVLLAVWTSWSRRSEEQLAALKSVQAKYAAEPNLIILGLSVDESMEAAREAARKHAWSGMQGWLDAEGRGRLTTALEMDSLPAVCLLDTTGRVIARELEGERLDFTLKRTLAADRIIDDEIKERIRRQFGDRDALIKNLQAQGVTFETYRQRVRAEILQERMNGREPAPSTATRP